MPIRRGHIYFVNLDPVFGRELGGGYARPIAVLSINDINQKPLVVTIVPGSSKQPLRSYRNIVAVEPNNANGLTLRTYFQCHQIRAIDPGRIIGPHVGSLSAQDLDRIAESVKYTLGFI